jgi:hypothetical protein
MTTAHRNPTTANQAALVPLLTGAALHDFTTAIAGTREAGLVYKGTPDDPRVHVAAATPPNLVFLRSCPLPNRKSPFVPYFAATGKPAISPTATPGPRVWADVTLKRINGIWRISSYDNDYTEPCSA